MILRTIALLALWIALQGEATFGNVVGGLSVIAGLALLFPSTRRSEHRLHPVGLLVFVGRLLVDLVTSSLAVARTVLRPSPERTATAVVPVPLTTPSRLVASIVANSITLTPGTLTVDIEASNGSYVLSVHVLGAFEHDEFVASIAALEARVERAVTPTGAPVAAAAEVPS